MNKPDESDIPMTQWSPNRVAISTDKIPCDILEKALKENERDLKWALDYYDPIKKQTNIDEQYAATKDLQDSWENAMKQAYNQPHQRKLILELKIKQIKASAAYQKELDQKIKVMNTLNRMETFLPPFKTPTDSDLKRIGRNEYYQTDPRAPILRSTSVAV